MVLPLGGRVCRRLLQDLYSTVGVFFYILFRRYSYKIRKALGVKAFLKRN
jgi:hypothetical protein